MSFNKKNRDTVPGPVRAKGSMGYWQRQPPPTYLLFVPFWVLNEHHDVTLPGADCVHGELGRLLHHVPSGLDTCSQVYTARYKLGQAPTVSPSGTWDQEPFLPLPCGRWWQTAPGIIRSKTHKFGDVLHGPVTKTSCPQCRRPRFVP